MLSKFKIPFVTTWNSLDIVPISNPLNFGSPGVVARRFSNIIVQNCDLLICVGARINEVNTHLIPKVSHHYRKKLLLI